MRVIKGEEMREGAFRIWIPSLRISRGGTGRRYKSGWGRLTSSSYFVRTGKNNVYLGVPSTLIPQAITIFVLTLLEELAREMWEGNSGEGLLWLKLKG